MDENVAIASTAGRDSITIPRSSAGSERAGIIERLRFWPTTNAADLKLRTEAADLLEEIREEVRRLEEKADKQSRDEAWCELHYFGKWLDAKLEGK